MVKTGLNNSLWLGAIGQHSLSQLLMARDFYPPKEQLHLKWENQTFVDS